MKNIEKEIIKSKKFKKISLILQTIALLFLILLIINNTAIRVISVIIAIILTNIASIYLRKNKELKNKIEYMKLHEDIIEDTKN